MNWLRRGDLLDRAFAIGVALKGLDGLLEMAGGALLAVVAPSTIDRLARAITRHELSEDPHDYIATHLLHLTGGLTSSSVRFGAVYLLTHGVVKVVLVAAVLSNRLWAYPWMIAFLLAFIGYQAYRMTFAPSAGLVALTVFDVAVAWLTYREYMKQRVLKRERAARRGPG